MVVLQGIALFAFVPLVLWLFLAQPLGPRWSLALGAASLAHNLFLIGIRNTLWVFRIVGGWWLLAAAWHAGRLFWY